MTLPISTTLRIRKLLGTIALVVFVLTYALIVVALASSRLAQLGWAVALAFYAIAGLAWVPPAGAIINWMHKR